MNSVSILLCMDDSTLEKLIIIPMTSGGFRSVATKDVFHNEAYTILIQKQNLLQKGFFFM